MFIVKYGKNFCYLELSKEFLDLTPKVQPINKINQLDFIKIRNFCSAKNPVKRLKGQPQAGKAYLQITDLTKILYPKDTKNTLRLTVKTLTTQLGKGQKTKTDTKPERK